MKKHYDIFISYRRKDVGDKAEHLKDLLEINYKNRISFDRENLSGRFNVKLIYRIDHAKDFLLILGKNSLSYSDDDCSPQTVSFYKSLICLPETEFAARMEEIGLNAKIDYVRIEIGRALQNKSLGIIPIVPEQSTDYNFASLKLPEDIAGIKNFEAIFYSNNPDTLFKNILPTIHRYLKSKPDIQRSRYFAFLMAIVMLLAIIFFNVASCFNKKKLYLQESIIEKCSSYGISGVKLNKKLRISQLDGIYKIIDNTEEIILNGDTSRIGRFEVSIEQWNSIMGLSYKKEESLFPKTNISWGECLFFFNELYRLTRINFRLPTEEEWMYAAHGKDKESVYSGGNNPDKVAWYENNSKGIPHKCKSEEFLPNSFGLFFMSGNVSEFCSDTFLDKTNIQNNLSSKVIKGGNFTSSTDEIKIDSRASMDENIRSSTVGFRIIIDLN